MLKSKNIKKKITKKSIKKAKRKTIKITLKKSIEGVSEIKPIKKSGLGIIRGMFDTRRKSIETPKPYTTNEDYNIFIKEGSGKIKVKKIKNLKRIKIKTIKIPIKKAEWIKTGMSGFDALFEHGIPRGHSVLLEGGPGVGKTIMSLQIAYNACKAGKKVLYMSFEEPEENLILHMKNFGWNPDELIKKDLLRIKRFNALDVARSVEALLSEAKKELLIEIQPVFFPSDFKPDIICVDSLTSIASAFTGEEGRFRIYMEQLFRYLEKTDITSFLIREVGHPTHIGGVGYTEKGEAISFLSDGIICLYNVIYDNGTRGFAIEVLKMRGENINRRIIKTEITKHGLKVYPKKLLLGKQHIKYNLA